MYGIPRKEGGKPGSETAKQRKSLLERGTERKVTIPFHTSSSQPHNPTIQNEKIDRRANAVGVFSSFDRLATPDKSYATWIPRIAETRTLHDIVNVSLWDIGMLEFGG